MLIYDKYENSYYEVIPVKKIEEKIEELRKKYNDYDEKEQRGDIFGFYNLEKEKIIHKILGLEELIKENCEVEDEEENVISYKNWCMEKLEEIRKEQNKMYETQDKDCSDALRGLYLDENNEVELTHKELITFLSYYNFDMIEYKQYYDFLQDDDIIELFHAIHKYEIFKVRWI